MEDYYQILGVPPNATQEEIGKRYRFLALAYHPDRFSSEESKIEAGREMARINAAHQVLSDPLKRAAYDRQRAGQYVAGGSSTSGSTQSTSGQWSSASPPDNRIDEAFRYFEVLIHRWNNYIQLSDQNIHLKHAVQGFISTARAISAQLLTCLGEQGAKLFSEEIDEGLKAALFINIALGIELQATAPPPGFSHQELQEYASLPILSRIKFAIDYGKSQGVYSTSQAVEIHNSVATRLDEVCWASQRVGQEIATKLKNAPNTASRQETRSGRTQQQRPLVQHCHSCEAIGETKYLTFRQLIGYLVFARSRTKKGEFCVKCATQHFWEFTGITLLLGWLWPGAIVVPFFVLANLINYGKYKELRERAGHFENPAQGWKNVTLSIIFIAISVLILVWFSSSNKSSLTYAGVSGYGSKYTPVRQVAYSTATPEIAVVPNLLPTKAPTLMSSCTHWSEIDINDEGRWVCAYGIVHDAYWGDEKRFFITFSDQTSAFRFIVLGGYYFNDVIGYCVEATGVVKAYDGIPYMELGEELVYYRIPGECPY